MDNAAEVGFVEEVLPKRMYRIRLESGGEIRGSLSVQSARALVRLKKGDRITIRRSQIDPTRGRILRKISNPEI